MSSSDETASPAPDADRAACTACRATGRVSSNLGGSPSEIACPWCEGTGRFIPEHDAQAARREAAAGT